MNRAQRRQLERQAGRRRSPRHRGRRGAVRGELSAASAEVLEGLARKLPSGLYVVRNDFEGGAR